MGAGRRGPREVLLEALFALALLLLPFATTTRQAKQSNTDIEKVELALKAVKHLIAYRSPGFYNGQRIFYHSENITKQSPIYQQLISDVTTLRCIIMCIFLSCS